MNNFKVIKKVLNDYVNYLDTKYIKRYSKTTFRDVLYQLSIKTINNTSYDNAAYIINRKNNTNISSSTFKKKNNFITSDDIINLNKNLLDVIYSDNKPRTIAVDGTHLKCLKSLHSYGVKYASSNETYTQLLVSGLYDVNNNILINYNHSFSLNERECFTQQLDYIKPNDTLIFDRGYYSLDLMNLLNVRGINYVFRVKATLNDVKQLILSQQQQLIICDNKIVTYYVPNGKEPYYLLTNLLDTSISDLSDLYADRWSIETHFKRAKYYTSLLNINSKQLSSLLRDIHMHNFIFILYHYFNNIITPMINKKNYHLNDKLCIEIFAHDILHILLYKKKYKTPITAIINLLPLVYIRKRNRHYTRESKRVISSWYIRPQKNRDVRHDIPTKHKLLKDVYSDVIII